MSPDYDIAVVGAGPAGAATARWLALSGYRVVLLERSRFDTPRVGESLAPGVQPLLVELGVWSQFLDLCPLPSYGTQSVWGGPTAEQHSHLLTPYMCGWHIDRLAFDGMLAAAAVKIGVQLRLDARVVHCAPDVNGDLVLQIANHADSTCKTELRAKFVVDATGRVSALARSFGARRVVFDRLVGIAANFKDVYAESHCYTLVEATPHGWWYSAPVGQDRSVTIFMTDGDLSRVQNMWWLQQWKMALPKAVLTAARIKGAALTWGPRTFSAVSQRLLRSGVDSARWLAVGDAALAVDPISGSGVVRALRTARAAASTIQLILSGNVEAMTNYESDRNEECTTFLVQRAAYYRMEQRWPNALFWQRRIALH